jgi:hypothetical protein
VRNLSTADENGLFMEGENGTLRPVGNEPDIGRFAFTFQRERARIPLSAGGGPARARCADPFCKSCHGCSDVAVLQDAVDELNSVTSSKIFCRRDSADCPRAATIGVQRSWLQTQPLLCPPGGNRYNDLLCVKSLVRRSRFSDWVPSCLWRRYLACNNLMPTKTNQTMSKT